MRNLYDRFFTHAICYNERRTKNVFVEKEQIV